LTTISVFKSINLKGMPNVSSSAVFAAAVPEYQIGAEELIVHVGSQADAGGRAARLVQSPAFADNAAALSRVQTLLPDTFL
jgi:hypothetical protein